MKKAFQRVVRLLWEDAYLAVGLVQVVRGRMEAAGLRGGQELYCCRNQTSLVPHGQQDVVVLLPQAPVERCC